MQDLADGLSKEWHVKFGGVEAWQWVGLGCILLACFVAFRVFSALARRVVRRFFPGTEQKPSDATTHNLVRAFALLGSSYVLWPMAKQLNLPMAASAFTLAVSQSGMLLGAIFLAIFLWDAVCDTVVARTESQRAEKLLVPVTRKLIRFCIIVAGSLLAFSVFGVNVAGVVAGLGIGGIVVALAAKDSVENVFGSLTILFDMPFKLGDWVKIGAVEGVVEEINLRSTRLRTFEDTLITLPNANLIRAAVENYGARRSRRQRINIRVGYDTKPAELQGLCQDIRTWLEAQQEVAFSRSIVAVTELTDVSVGIYVLTFFEVETLAQELALKDRLLTEVLKAAQTRGIRLANAAPLLPTAE